MHMLFHLFLIVAIIFTYFKCKNDYGVYEQLVSASKPEQIEAAFERLLIIKEYAGTLPKNVSRRAFHITIELRDRAFESKSEGDEYWRVGHWTAYISHLAAISGDVELLRKISATYFGSEIQELKGTWLEEFLQYNPELFFSLPDTWELWKHAGGAAWCCDEPEVTIPIIKRFAPFTTDAQRILDDLKNTVFVSEKETEWAKEARKLLSESE